MQGLQLRRDINISLVPLPSSDQRRYDSLIDHKERFRQVVSKILDIRPDFSLLGLFLTQCWLGARGYCWHFGLIVDDLRVADRLPNILLAFGAGLLLLV